MRKRRTADEVARVLREIDRDVAKGLTVSDICRKIGIAETTYYRWRQQHAPDQVDSDRRCRELELEVERLKRLVAELMLDKQMLQDIAKKSGEPRPAAGCRRLSERAVRGLRASGLPSHGPISLGPAVPPKPTGRRAGPEQGDQAPGAPTSSLRLSPNPCHADPSGLVSEPQACKEAVDCLGAATAAEAEKTQETWPQTGNQREQLRSAAGPVQERRLDL